uniref:BHLH domain-containing protein n=1 Tax=Mycena chlorophos TaxID=658473 RepID=A0ABQ0LYE3_MYCCL|nr:predicted protein [Mycena chlorophos]
MVAESKGGIGVPRDRSWVDTEQPPSRRLQPQRVLHVLSSALTYLRWLSDLSDVSSLRGKSVLRAPGAMNAGTRVPHSLPSLSPLGGSLLRETEPNSPDPSPTSTRGVCRTSALHAALAFCRRCNRRVLLSVQLFSSR